MNPQWSEQLALLPEYLSAHLTLTLAALGGGCLGCIPIGWAMWRWPKCVGPILTLAGLIQTIPSLAFLALMVPLLGRIGFLPAWIALMAYSMLPILRNWHVGYSGIDPNLMEAARGLGMRKNQILWRIQLPLALPTLVAGIRTSTVWVVGIATLATPVGATGLGNYIFGGLQTQNQVAVGLGCVAAAVLALSLDRLVSSIEQAVRTGRHWRLAGILGLGLVLLGAATSPQWRTWWSSGGPPPVRIGAKTFTEQFLLARLLQRQVEKAGLPATRREGLGSTVIFDALRMGKLDAYIDYSGTIWFHLMEKKEVLPPAEMRAELARWLEAEHGIRVLNPLGFQNAYAFAMRRDRAEELGIRTLADLAGHASRLSLGADYEFFARSDWGSVQQAYDLSFRSELQMDAALMYLAVQEQEVDVVVAFSTDGRVDAYDLVLLDDPEQALPPYEALCLLSPTAATQSDVVAALQSISGQISPRLMRQANRMVDVDKNSLEQAVDWLEGQLAE